MISRVGTTMIWLLPAALIVSALLTMWLRAWTRSRAMLDLPGARRNHRLPTPRGGGAAIVGATLATALASALGGASIRPSLLALLAGTALVAGIGWRDDRAGVTVGVRLCVHLLATVVLLVSLHHLEGLDLPWWAWSVAVLFAVGLTNVWNFMDGIDGIAVSQAILVAIGVAALVPTDDVQLLAVLLAFAGLGFLPFNFPRASIFLGDVGSGAIGFFLAGLLLVAFSVRGAQILVPGAVLLSAFLVDTSMTLGKRVIQRRPWWRAHREHTYQWLVRAGFSHARVTAGYALWTLGMLAVVLGSPAPLATSIGVVVLMLAASLWLGLRYWVRERIRKGLV